VIDFEAFKLVSSQHNFPWDFPSAEIATAVVTMMLSNPGIYSVVAEQDGKIVGSSFLDERNPIAGIGPISVDPAVQNQTIGRRLMGAVMDRSAQRGFAGTRLVQAAYHNRSLCLYTKLGFDTRETLSKMYGPPLKLKFPGYEVRPATEQDCDVCNQLCRRVHGHDRNGELRDAIKQGTARVVEHMGRITGYATDIAFFAHAVGETNREARRLSPLRLKLAEGAFCCRRATASCFAGVSKTVSSWCIK
jgi:GNAT superfamily N-acetyltransferase